MVTAHAVNRDGALTVFRGAARLKLGPATHRTLHLAGILSEAVQKSAQVRVDPVWGFVEIARNAPGPVLNVGLGEPDGIAVFS
ncbi:hypothetical protein SRM_01516 [Salinibacter ruber M8]|uniref:Uncharacterized protein n=1 Tax=Salinibacter ruber (strain M8) TaxID=761659 RepID=D5H8T2_SALRM|nr:hypothetical protein SRM_01516 [Salinibacter ruber M8]